MVDEGKMSINRAYRQIVETTRNEGDLRQTRSITVPSTAEPATHDQEIEFEFVLPYETVEKYMQEISDMYKGVGLGLENSAVCLNGRINIRSGKVVSAGVGEIAREVDLEADEREPRTEPLFGYAIDAFSEQVTIAPGHTIVCGLTQESGKTTALEGLLARWAGKKIVVFICKRGEEVFQQYTKIVPFIRDDSVATNLPDIQFSHKLELKDGIQVMDLQNFEAEVQAKIIGSVAEEVQKEWRDVILVVPEAWQILPRDRDSPAKLPVEILIRQGATNGNFVVLDSQDISGIHVPIRKNIGNWIIGRQNEINEIKRAIEHLTIKKDWEEMKQSIQTLKRGQFYVVTRGEVTKAFAWPVWMTFDDALTCVDQPELIQEIKKKYKDQTASIVPKDN